MTELVKYGWRESWVVDETKCKHMATLAVKLYNSGVLPKYVQSPEVAFAMMVKAQSLGLPEATAWDYFYELGGKIELKTATKAALIARSGGTIRTVEKSATRVVIECTRHGWGTEIFSFSYEEAVKAGLTKNATYSKYPVDMLWARALTRAANRMFPDVLLGTDTLEGYEETNDKDKTQAGPQEVAKQLTQSIEEETSSAAKAPAEGACQGGERNSPRDGGAEQASADSRGDAGEAHEPRGGSAGEKSDVREPHLADGDATRAGGGAESHAGAAHQSDGLREGSGRDNEARRIRATEPSLQDNISEDSKRIADTVASVFHGAAITFESIPRFSRCKEHSELLTRVGKKLGLTDDYKKKHGMHIYERLIELEPFAIEEELTAAMSHVMREIEGQ